MMTSKELGDYILANPLKTVAEIRVDLGLGKATYRKLREKIKEDKQFNEKVTKVLTNKSKVRLKAELEVQEKEEAKAKARKEREKEAERILAEKRAAKERKEKEEREAREREKEKKAEAEKKAREKLAEINEARAKVRAKIRAKAKAKSLEEIKEMRECSVSRESEIGLVDEINYEDYTLGEEYPVLEDEYNSTENYGDDNHLFENTENYGGDNHLFENTENYVDEYNSTENYGDDNHLFENTENYEDDYNAYDYYEDDYYEDDYYEDDYYEDDYYDDDVVVAPVELQSGINKTTLGMLRLTEGSSTADVLGVLGVEEVVLKSRVESKFGVHKSMKETEDTFEMTDVEEESLRVLESMVSTLEPIYSDIEEAINTIVLHKGSLQGKETQLKAALQIADIHRQRVLHMGEVAAIKGEGQVEVAEEMGYISTLRRKIKTMDLLATRLLPILEALDLAATQSWKDYNRDAKIKRQLKVVKD